MRIVIDMQGTQTQSRNRGIGRYSLALVRGLVRQRGEHEIVLVFNALLQDGLDSLLTEFAQSLGREQLRLWVTPDPVSQLDVGNRPRWALAEQLYESFMASLEPDIVLITSLFEGLSDDAAMSIHNWRQDYPTAVVLYDLIPLIQQKPYFDNPAYARWYGEKIRHMQRADLLLAISGSSRREGLEHLGLPAAQIVNMSSACDPLFRPLRISPERRQELASHYRLEKPFLMYTGGIDFRKNIEGLIRAFAQLPQALRSRHQLAIVCHIPDYERIRLERLAVQEGLAAGDLVLTGFVPDQHLLELYNLCELFVFPSRHEGFGLPALEAMACGAPVIVANNSSLPEVVGWDAATFDGHDDQAIADKLQQVLGDADFRQQLREHGLQQAARFSWDATASVALEALLSRAQKWHAEQATAALSQAGQVRPRLAFVSPLPAERSGISQYSAELLPVLARHYRIDVFVDQSTIDNPWINEQCGVCPASELPKRAADYDRVLYQFGNSSFHQHMFDLLEQVPGVVVLHDFFLSSVIDYMEWSQGRANYWMQALYASHGYPAVAARLQQADTAAVVWRYPANLPVLQQAKGVIVHSPYSLQLARRWYGPTAGQGWASIPLLRETATAGSAQRQQARQALGIAGDVLLVCSFGMLGQNKLNHRLLDAWLASSLASDPRAQLVFVGELGNDAYAAQLKQRLADMPEAAERIRITGWADEQTYAHYLAAADIGVQLRTRSRGETSAAVLDCLNHGLATIVNANGSMADLPDDAVLRLADDFTDQQLSEALECLWHNAALREQLGAAAAQLIHTQHTPEHCAGLYQQAIEASYQRWHNSAEGVARTLHDQQSLAGHPAGVHCRVATSLDFNFPESPRQPQLLLDITTLAAKGDAAQPLTARLLDHWLAAAPMGYRLEPVWRNEETGYCYARNWTLARLGLDAGLLPDEPISPRSGDIWMALEQPARVPPEQQAWYDHLRYLGVHPALADATDSAGHSEQWFEGLTSALPSLPEDRSTPLLLVDISELVVRDVGTGIQRVVRNILGQWQQQPPAGHYLLPVYARSDRPGYYHARRFVLQRAGLPATLLPDAPVNPLAGDSFIGLDLQPLVVHRQRDTYRRWRAAGVNTRFVVYDLLPVRHPQFFRDGARDIYQRWLEVVSEADGLISISRAVADQLHEWLDQRDRDSATPLPRPSIDWFHLGAELDLVPVSAAAPEQVPESLSAINMNQPIMLMVGTLEPRKAHQQVLEAFEQLWNTGVEASLVIVGRLGWQVEALAQSLRAHPQAGKRLFWLEAGDDASLQWLYQHSSCLIAASQDEGFGLPLIEAARYHLPILARDIPVFREVAGDHAAYFTAANASEMALALRNWLAEQVECQHVAPQGMNWQNWQASAAQLAERLRLSERFTG